MARLQIEYWGKKDYDARRYGAPWIAKVVSWDIINPPEFELGHDLEIDATPGDVVSWGQIDYRDPQGMRSWWGIVSQGIDENLSVKKCTQRRARNHWLRMEAVKKGLYKTLLHSCRPDSPLYDKEFHARIYLRQPNWFNGDDGLLPPAPPASASELN